MSQSVFTATNTLKTALAASVLARELGDSFPPARAAASLLVLIFETIQSMKTNQIECYRLAERCLDLLRQIHAHMPGDSWEAAPQALVRNLRRFEGTLTSIHDRLIEEVQNKWHSRMFRRVAITEALSDYNTELDDAARSFQITSLINIHFAVDHGSTPPLSSQSQTQLIRAGTSQGSDDLETEDFSNFDSKVSMDNSNIAAHSLTVDSVTTCASDGSWEPVELCHKNTLSSLSLEQEVEDQFCESPAHSSVSSSRSTSPDQESRNVTEDEQDILEYHEFHQSEIVLGKRSTMKDGWWGGIVEVNVRVGGRTRAALMKRYEGPPRTAIQSWTRDVEFLRRVSHTNLPHLLGSSVRSAPTPFIVLSDVNTIPLRKYLKHAVENSSPTECADLICRFYETIMGIASYIERELNLSVTKLQDYVETTSFRVDTSGRLVAGLPLLLTDDVITVRKWPLAHTVREMLLQSLPMLEDVIAQSQHISSLVTSRLDHEK
ncbi:hypothetical protein EIP91_006643 [Steccherinum ochraceum]|uniref:Mixed lineage kinase domain-containing protein n=1 Tax=Steccherinum ochraceum TaxID=92696 RepID=A0A4V2MVM0_9APHY|nr:hypothetical protein EIP91_006643 [Steccherinum ochraceum]